MALDPVMERLHMLRGIALLRTGPLSDPVVGEKGFGMGSVDQLWITSEPPKERLSSSVRLVAFVQLPYFMQARL